MANNIYIGTSKVKNIYVGTSKTKKIYFDTDLVWQSAIPVERPTSLTPSGTYNGSEITNGYVCPSGVTMTGSASGTNAGTYIAVYTPDEDHCWSDTEDRTPVTVTLTIGKAVAGAKPTSLTPSGKYNGNVITNGYTCPVGINMSGNDRGISAGTYTAVYTPDSNHKWDDNTTDSVTVVLTIIADLLCFKANSAGSTIRIRNGTGYTRNFETSTDGLNWSTFVAGTTVITLANVEDQVYFRGNNPSGLSSSSASAINFRMTGSISASGNIMGLIDNGVCSSTTIPGEYCFASLFSGCSSLTTAPKLPATSLTKGCYSRMLYNCSSLVTAPSLPATTLAEYCYSSMFHGCTSLVETPVLAATTLAKGCYTNMFDSCSSLRTASSLLATTVVENCYDAMFIDCTSLTTVPTILPAQTLARGCYTSMFYRCSSLTTAPSLPATTLAEYCYNNMFHGCTSLVRVPSLPATVLPSDCYNSMYYDCTSLIISDTSGSGYSNVLQVPTTGTLSGVTQNNVFTNCAGTRSRDDIQVLYQTESYTYYTQNPTV